MHRKEAKDEVHLLPALQVSSYVELKAFLIRFAALSAGAIPRSALHMAVSGKAPRGQGEVLGPWVPGPAMMCGAARLPAVGLPGPEAELFVQQAELAVSCYLLSFSLKY
jgi:hypothetical protein